MTTEENVSDEGNVRRGLKFTRLGPLAGDVPYKFLIRTVSHHLKSYKHHYSLLKIAAQLIRCLDAIHTLQMMKYESTYTSILAESSTLNS